MSAELTPNLAKWFQSHTAFFFSFLIIYILPWYHHLTSICLIGSHQDSERAGRESSSGARTQSQETGSSRGEGAP